MNDVNSKIDESTELLHRIIRENLIELGGEELMDLTIRVLSECDDFLESSRQTHDVAEIAQTQKALKSKIQGLIEKHGNEVQS
jgi:hypothetical protein